MTANTSLISAASLLNELSDPRLIVLDVRHEVGQPRQRDRYERAHIPGAIYVELRDEFASAASDAGRHPLPSRAQLDESMRSWGIMQHSRVVVTGDNRASAPGRAWWVLRWAGLDDVRILDGGLEAWQAIGAPVTRREPTPQRGDFAVRTESLSRIDADAVRRHALTGQLVDARQRDAYLKGHVPGAVNVPFTDLLTAAGAVNTDRLASHFEAVGIALDEPIALMCGAGIAAAASSALLEGIGIATQLYVGSWSEWTHDPRRPKAFGAS
ncbi:rhodanese-like domain-containing protein [Rathayibacter sp. VKM Ac-2760]|uniref:sulfurtransferase n=1 Tax=Rathayibacter sp. VKM Ac-2760 TaxID=2609253 RepID=UPI001316C909|nr:rhodanese-like domain-containing protein [Rathayibacter sp. VKM Ac-2760]QHC61193.1 sulfurtransferase [Rathayibacter sp. VKM Ac-2760]